MPSSSPSPTTTTAPPPPPGPGPSPSPSPLPLILVTGASGFLGSHICAQLLLTGQYRVRAAVRSTARSAWLERHFASSSYPSSPSPSSSHPSFSLTQVPDMSVPGAYDDAVRGVDGVVHVASVMDDDGGRDGGARAVVAAVVRGAVGALGSAAREWEGRGKGKCFVYTSSSLAAYTPGVEGGRVDGETWNGGAVGRAYAAGGEGEEEDVAARAMDVYAASKVEAERAVWAWVADNGPAFRVNAVLPNVNFGRSLDPANQGHPTTSGWVVALATGRVPEHRWRTVVPQYYINVEDTARLHVAALTRPDLNGERIFGFAGRFNWNTLLRALRKMYPEKTFYDDRDGQGEDLSEIVGAAKAEQLLKDMGRPGWKGLEESLRENLEGVDL
ncbi:aldehyde reductase ii [Diplodia corticola]|uniref:Aldehyde reductase ii n=1 Tax=Diplodia corticola TaxID=236234 RepID=A0A1J9QYT1_9PEZI|nr:aldehyde reductase ii [Diplodia corticola]OJD33154.1 aldehyde reductase ii [Diplodia corticola]